MDPIYTGTVRHRVFFTSLILSVPEFKDFVKQLFQFFKDCIVFIKALLKVGCSVLLNYINMSDWRPLSRQKDPYSETGGSFWWGGAVPFLEQ